MNIYLNNNKNNIIQSAVEFLLNKINTNKLEILNYIVILPTTFCCKRFKEEIFKIIPDKNFFLPRVYTKKNFINYLVGNMDFYYNNELELLILVELLLDKYNFFANINTNNVIQLAKCILKILKKKANLRITTSQIKQICKYEYSEHFNFLLNKIDEIEKDLNAELFKQNHLSYNLLQQNIFKFPQNINYKYLIINEIHLDLNFIEFLQNNNTNVFLHFDEKKINNKAYYFYLSKLLDYSDKEQTNIKPDKEQTNIKQESIACKKKYTLNNDAFQDNIYSKNINQLNKRQNIKNIANTYINIYINETKIDLEAIKTYYSQQASSKDALTNSLDTQSKIENINLDVFFNYLLENFNTKENSTEEKLSSKETLLSTENLLDKKELLNKNKKISFYEFENGNQEILFICQQLQNIIKTNQNKKIAILIPEGLIYENLKNQLLTCKINFNIAETRNKSNFALFFIELLSLINVFEINAFLSILKKIIYFFYIPYCRQDIKNFSQQIFNFENICRDNFVIYENDLEKIINLQNKKKFYFIKYFYKFLCEIRKSKNIKTILNKIFIFLDKISKLKEKLLISNNISSNLLNTQSHFLQEWQMQSYSSSEQLRILEICNFIINSKIKNTKLAIDMVIHFLQNVKTTSKYNNLINYNDIELTLFNSAKSLSIEKVDLIYIMNVEEDFLRKITHNEIIPQQVIEDLGFNLDENEYLYYFSEVFRQKFILSSSVLINKSNLIFDLQKLSYYNYEINYIKQNNILYKFRYNNESVNEFIDAKKNNAAANNNAVTSDDEVSNSNKAIRNNEAVNANAVTSNIDACTVADAFFNDSSNNQAFNIKEIHKNKHKVLYSTYIEQILQDPYTFYIEKVLKLKKVNHIKSLPESNIFGSIVHEVIKIYYLKIQSINKSLNFQSINKSLNFNIKTKLIKIIINDYFKQSPEVIKNIYKQKVLEFLNIIVFYAYKLIQENLIKPINDTDEVSDFFLTTDNNHAPDIKSFFEKKVSTTIMVNHKIYKLKSIIDLIQIKQGNYLLTDYKTGVLPSKKQVLNFSKNQLLTSCIIIIFSFYIQKTKENISFNLNNLQKFDILLHKIWQVFINDNKNIELLYIKISAKINNVKKTNIILDFSIFSNYIKFLLDNISTLDYLDPEQFKNKNHDKYLLLI